MSSFIFSAWVIFMAVFVGYIAANAEKENNRLLYSGTAFEIRLIKGDCFARETKTSDWFDCVGIFKNKILINGA